MRTLMLMAAGLALASGPALASTHAAKAPAAKVSMTQARAIALKADPGKVTKAKFEKVGTGRYDFAIKSKAGVKQVRVDAQTGKIV